MTAPAGAYVKIFMDTQIPIAYGDIIETGTGRRYQVDSVRVQKYGKHRGRQHLGCVVLAPGVEIKGATVIPLRWYRR